VVNARILNREGELGEIVPGARADLLVVDGNPLEDLAVLAGQGEQLLAVIVGGEPFLNRLD
jgi:imidazolonepropionase-like amidohydrolase